MNFAFIQKLIDKWWITPAWWRLIEAFIICLWAYITSALISWEAFNMQSMIIATVTPLALYFRKRKADLLDDNQ